jgi:hypothetical protein
MGCTQSLADDDRRPVVRWYNTSFDKEAFAILEPIMVEFVSLYCVVDPKHHVMMSELTSAFFTFALRRVRFSLYDEKDVQSCMTSLLERAAPDVKISGYTIAGRPNNAATGIKLLMYPTFSLS